jgi:hypothetical protein
MTDEPLTFKKFIPNKLIPAPEPKDTVVFIEPDVAIDGSMDGFNEIAKKCKTLILTFSLNVPNVDVSTWTCEHVVANSLTKVKLSTTVTKLTAVIQSSDILPKHVTHLECLVPDGDLSILTKLEGITSADIRWMNKAASIVEPKKSASSSTLKTLRCTDMVGEFPSVFSIFEGEVLESLTLENCCLPESLETFLQRVGSNVVSLSLKNSTFWPDKNPERLILGAKVERLVMDGVPLTMDQACQLALQTNKLTEVSLVGCSSDPQVCSILTLC